MSTKLIDLTELICVICLEPYSDNQVALILGCGHSFCSKCLFQLHKDFAIQCPEDRTVTEIESVDYLIKNISLMRMIQEEQSRQFLNQNQQLIENIKQLRKNIHLLIDIKRKNIETNLQRIVLHKSSLESFYHLGDSLLRKISTNTYFNKNIDSYDLKKLYDLIDSIRCDFENYEKFRQKQFDLLISLESMLEQSNKSILVHDLMYIMQYVSDLDEQKQQNIKLDKQLNESINIYNYLKEFEEKYFHGVYDLKTKDNVKLNDIIDGLEYDMKFAKFRIGIVGNSGKGKSSLINRARGLADPLQTKNLLINQIDEYDIAAPTGVGETTKFPVTYSWKLKPSIILKDFPGFGLCKQPVVETYVNKYLFNDNCHLYVILYTERLTSLEIELAKLIKTKLKKHVILARSKIDRDFNDLKEENTNKSDDVLFKELKTKIQFELNQTEFDTYFSDSTFERKNLKLFLISCRKGNETKFEMNSFFDEIFKCLPNELNDTSASITAINNSGNVFLNLSRNEIHRIRKKLEKRILGLSILSATTDLIPIGGQIADMSILIGECTRYREYFCLNKEYINELANKYNVSDDKVASILKIIAFDAKYLNLKDFILGLISAISIGISVFQAVTSAVSLGINIATFGTGCLVSAAITGPISFYLCKSVLQQALNQMENDALQIIEEIHKEIKDKFM